MAFKRPIAGVDLPIIDKKGRVLLPSTIRNAIIANTKALDEDAGSREFYLAKHPEAPALIGLEAAELKEMNEKISSSATDAADVNPLIEHEAKRTSIYSLTEPVPFDDSGRFTLSAAALRRGNLKGHAFIFGTGTTLQIWSPEEYRAYPKANPDLLAELSALMTEKGLES